MFVSILFWTWLWGVWGMLLSIPLTVIVKVVTQHVEQLQPVAGCWANDASSFTPATVKPITVARRGLPAGYNMYATEHRSISRFV